MAKKVIAITSCPVGVAHTYMAAENLEKAGRKMGVDMKVETHGSIGVENEFTKGDIEDAEAIIIASDMTIDKSRFVGKKIIEVGVQEGIRNPEGLLNKALSGEGKIHEASNGETQINYNEDEKVGKTLYRSLMNGVSYMVPFVVTGGLLIAIALTIGGTPGAGGLSVAPGSFWDKILQIGVAAMGLMVPILSGYIAYSIAERPGLVPGMIGGIIATNGSFYGSKASTGFIGGIIAGFLAGYIALAIKKIKVPKAMQSVMPIIFIPVITSVLVGLIFIYLIGAPIATLFTGLTAWLATLNGANSLILAVIIGAMIAFDMGGPFNKVAFLFASGLIAQGIYTVMGMAAVAICIPPIALGVATLMLKDKFTVDEKQAGKAALFMGMFGITEGAIPFAAKDPLKVIPSIMIGSIAGSIVAALTKVGDHVAHGGPIVAVLGAVDNTLMFFVSVIVGVAVTILMLKILKKDVIIRNSESIKKTITETSNNPYYGKDKALNQKENNVIHEEELKLTDLTEKNLIYLNLSGKDKESIFKEMLNNPILDSRISSKEEVLASLIKREDEGTTGLGDNLAIPHAKTDAVKKATVVFGRAKEGVEWDSLDGNPAKLVFMLLVPEKEAGDTHLKILQILARKMMDPKFKEDLLVAKTEDDVYEIFKTVK